MTVLNFADVYFFCKKLAFFCKIVPLLKEIVWNLCQKFFSFVLRVCKIKGYCYLKCKFYRFSDCSNSAINQENNNDVTIYWHDVIVNFFDVALLALSKLVTGPSFMLISSLVLDFSFIRVWPGIRKSKIPLSEFCPISGDWLPNARVTTFSVYRFWLIKGKPTEGRGILPPPHHHSTPLIRFGKFLHSIGIAISDCRGQRVMMVHGQLQGKTPKFSCSCPHNKF